MDIKQELNFLKAEIDARLEIFFQKKIKETKKISPLVGKGTSAIKEFTLRGGKRIRPILFYYGYLAAGGKNKKRILDAAISIEIIHNYLLVHDDIIDKDQFRRGKPTIHQKYKEIYREITSKAYHLGISAGIVAGDLACSFGYEILAKSKFPNLRKIKTLDRLSRLLTEVGSGEILDVLLGATHQLSKKEIFKILEYKTARYTIEGPLHLGAILAGADKKVLKKLSDYAIPLGIAFQLRDDILGIFGEEKIFGKPIGSDLREGKQTLLIYYAKKRGNKSERRIIEKVLGDQNLTKKQLKKIRKVIIKTGSFDFCKQLAEKLVYKSKIVIQKSDFPIRVKEFLTKLADFVIEREK